MTLCAASCVGARTAHEQASNRKTLIYLILTLNHVYPDYEFSTLRADHFRQEATGGSMANVKETIDTMLNDAARVWSDEGMGGTPVTSSSWRSAAAADAAMQLQQQELGGVLRDRRMSNDEENTAVIEGGESKSAPLYHFDSIPHIRDSLASHASARAVADGPTTRPALSSLSYQNFSKASTRLSDELWSVLDEVIVLSDCDVYTYLSGLDCEQAVSGGNDDDGNDPFSELGCLSSFNYFFMNKKLKRVLYFSCRLISKTAGMHGGYTTSDQRNAMASNAITVITHNYNAPAYCPVYDDIDFVENVDVDNDYEDEKRRRKDDADDEHDEMFFADEDMRM